MMRSRSRFMLFLFLFWFMASACYWNDVAATALLPNTAPPDNTQIEGLCRYDDPACYPVYADIENSFHADGIPYIGSLQAPIVIAQFSDFLCPHCSNYHLRSAERIITDFVHTGQARYEYYPMTFIAPPYSDTAAYAALCAGEQGAFWQFHHELFVMEQNEPRKAFVTKRMLTLGAKMGLDSATLQACMASERPLLAITTARAQSNRLGLTGTPSIYYSLDNGTTWTQVGADYDAISDVIARNSGRDA